MILYYTRTYMNKKCITDTIHFLIRQYTLYCIFALIIYWLYFKASLISNTLFKN